MDVTAVTHVTMAGFTAKSHYIYIFFFSGIVYIEKHDTSQKPFTFFPFLLQTIFKQLTFMFSPTSILLVDEVHLQAPSRDRILQITL